MRRVGFSKRLTILLAVIMALTMQTGATFAAQETPAGQQDTEKTVVETNDSTMEQGEEATGADSNGADRSGFAHRTCRHRCCTQKKEPAALTD